MEAIACILYFIYNYCTDFVINVANLLDLSYYEINAIIFCFFWPIATILLIIIYCIQKIRITFLCKKVQ